MPATPAISPAPRPRWGLCCQFLGEGPRFRRATHRHVGALGPPTRRHHLSTLARANALALAHAVERCAELGIRAFRITSQILPLATHPESGYELDDLEQPDVLVASFRAAGELARLHDVRLSFHPDQFVVLNSAHERTVVASLRELELQARVGELVGAEAITLHGGGLAGGLGPALERLERGIERLSSRARVLLALENDDRLFAPSTLLPLCERLGVPFVYDVHHHRCHPDGMGEADATEAGAASWRGREPWMHVSSPRDGWGARNPRPHADYVDVADVPAEWFGRAFTVDVEAKAKERAVLALQAEAERRVAGEWARQRSSPAADA